MSRTSEVTLTRARTIGKVTTASGRSTWSAGFGNTIDPFQANVSGRTHRTCRRRLRRLLQIYARRLAISNEDRERFQAAADELASWPANVPWMLRITAGHYDLTFWIIDAFEAELRGVRPKR